MKSLFAEGEDRVLPRRDIFDALTECRRAASAAAEFLWVDEMYKLLQREEELRKAPRLPG